MLSQQKQRYMLNYQPTTRFGVYIFIFHHVNISANLILCCYNKRGTACIIWPNVLVTICSIGVFVGQSGFYFEADLLSLPYTQAALSESLMPHDSSLGLMRHFSKN